MEDRFQMANQIGISEVVRRLGGKVYTPKANGKYMTYSLTKDEKNPSLQIDVRANRFYNFADDSNGGCIDLMMAARGCNHIEAVNILLDGSYSPLSLKGFKEFSPVAERGIEIEKVQSITDDRLRSYLMDVRKIPDTIYNKYCKQVRARIKSIDKAFTYVGFATNSGDFELRNSMTRYNKLCTGKGITHFKNGKTRLAVFEGFIDFLSYKVHHTDNHEDYIILNSTSNYRKCMELLRDYGSVHCYLDNDPTGKATTAEIIALVGARRCRDMSYVYKGYNDYNDWYRAELLKIGGQSNE
ncbi:MAG: toprim domain-containing protein [Rikenellaceae bacterium]